MAKAGGRKFDRAKVRRYIDTDVDPGRPFFDARQDVDWLLTFLERFRLLGWVPPSSDKEIAALRANDLAFHQRDGRIVYEFWVRGGQDDRVPPLTLFLHVDAPSGVIRIIGIYLTADVAKRRSLLTDLMFARAGIVDKILAQERSHG